MLVAYALDSGGIAVGNQNRAAGGRLPQALPDERVRESRITGADASALAELFRCGLRLLLGLLVGELDRLGDWSQSIGLGSPADVNEHLTASAIVMDCQADGEQVPAEAHVRATRLGRAIDAATKAVWATAGSVPGAEFTLYGP